MCERTNFLTPQSLNSITMKKTFLFFVKPLNLLFHENEAEWDYNEFWKRQLLVWDITLYIFLLPKNFKQKFPLRPVIGNNRLPDIQIQFFYATRVWQGFGHVPLIICLQSIACRHNESEYQVT